LPPSNPDFFIHAAHRSIANYGVFFNLDEKGRDLKGTPLTGKTLKRDDHKYGFLVGGNSCLAYQNDSVYGGLKRLAADKYFLRSTRKGDVTKYGVLIRIGNPPDLDYYKKALKALNFAIDCYVRIPLLLLDPDTRNKVFARRRSPANSGVFHTFAANKTGNRENNVLGIHGIYLDVCFPGNVLIHPALAWLTNALTREAVHSVLGPVYSYEQRKKGKHHPLFEKLNKIISRKELTSIINTGNYAKAFKLWNQHLAPLMKQSAEGNSASANAWFRNSVEKFNYLISEGGWICLGTNISENWKFDAHFVAHAGTAKAWESFICHGLLRGNSLTCEQLAKIKVLSIQKKFKSHLRKSPWMTTKQVK
jgi:hypothetical protein